MNTHDFTARVERALALHRGGQFAAAEAAYRQALALQPDDAELLQLLAMATLQDGRLAEAELSMQKALRLAPRHPGILFNAAHLASRLGRPQTAIDYLEQALRAHPGMIEARGNLGNLYFEQRRHAEAGAQYDAALRQNPNDAVALLGSGRVHHHHGRLAEAEAALLRAAALTPGRSDAPLALAWLYASSGRIADAGRLIDQVIASWPEIPSAWLIKANIASRAGQPAIAQEACERALRLAPQGVEALVSLACVHQSGGATEQARRYLAEARSISPEDPDVLFCESMLRLTDGDFAAGWPLYEARLDARLYVGQAERLPGPRWDGRPFHGRTLLLTQEQGIGDALQFLRFLPRVAELGDADRILLRVAPAIAALVARCGIGRVIATTDPLPQHDLHASLLSLPALLRLDSLHAIPGQPYLRCDPDRRQAWEARLGERTRPRVGVVWAGNPSHGNDHNRSLPLAQLAPLTGLAGFDWISLQVGPAAAQAESTPLRRFDAWLTDYDETAALLDCLDLVVSVDTSVAHLAGALGKRLFLLLPQPADFRWLRDRGDSPWYPSATLFRRAPGSDWTEVAGRAAEALRSLEGAAADPVVRGAPAPQSPAAAGIDLASRSGRYSRLVEARDGSFIVPARDRFVGRSLERYGEFSEGEAEVFRSLLRPGDVVVEAGANIGAHTLTFARRVGPTGRVHAFEPQRILFQMLAANLALNEIDNVFAYPDGLAEAPGEAHLPPLDYAEEFNFGGVGLTADYGERIRVSCIDDLGLGSLRLIKADVEGMEARVLRGAARTIARLRPFLYVENDRADLSAELIALIRELGYRAWWHAPPLFNPANFRGNTENVFGDLISLNLLCAPIEAAYSPGWPEVRE